MNEMSITVRPVQVEEVEELMHFAMPLFEDTFPHMDWEMVKQHAEAWASSDEVFFYRTDHAVGAGAIMYSLWEPYPVFIEEFVAAEPNHPGDGLAIYRAMNEWRKQKGATKFRFGTRNGLDLEPIAKALGAEKIQTIYEVSDA